MRFRTAFSSGPLLLCSLLLCAGPLCAQSEQTTSRCSTSSAQTESVLAGLTGEHPRVVIDEVRFDPPIHLPDSVLNEEIARANELEFDATSSGWVNEFVEAGIREAWQERGYFKVTVKPGEMERLGGDSTEQHFRVNLHIDEGLQYHLGDLTFVDAKALSPSELRNLVPLKEGEIFDVSKIRSGVAGLWKQYAAIGYIDFTAVPKTEIDDRLQRISLTLELDEEKQYRIGEVKVVGLDPALEALLGSKLLSGEVFNPRAIDDFVEQNRPSLPADLRQEDYLQERHDTRVGIVDLSFDFRAFDFHGCRKTTR